MSEKHERYETLLPCPFCGEVAHIEYVGRGQTDVYCDTPHCLRPVVSERNYTMAARQWNTRAPTQQQELRKVFAEVVQGLIERGVITAEDVASVGGVKNE